MQTIPLKGSAFPAAATTVGRPAVSSAPWRDKLETSQSNVLTTLLQKSGWLSKEQYCDAMEIAESLKKNIDQVLATSFLTQKQSELCAAAISYLERGIISEDLAADGLKVADARNISFVEGLKYFGFGW